jgi:hypothetical protein
LVLNVVRTSSGDGPLLTRLEDLPTGRR